ncbi:CRISPR-associated helicase Cas3' [Nocardiopsis dassonvillei]|uniref:CRISPR-associated helicase Cas3' n=1 Tax=Nocardiopsis dassonvillei TaxID=2014 RepID=UPI00362AB4B7
MSAMKHEGRPQPWKDRLSEAARAVWAKHDFDANGWLPLYRHMADSAAVATRLWDSWLPAQVRDHISRALPDGDHDARVLAVWLAATHDIGKATPAFACQVEDLADDMRAHGLDMPLQKQMADRNLAPHGLAGQLLLRDWLVEHHGWTERATHQLTVVAGGHHGVPPTVNAITALDRHPGLLRTPGHEQAWTAVQHELLDTAARITGASERLSAWNSLKLPQTAQVLLTALVITADWIASNPELFPLFPGAGERGSDPERTEAAWRLLDLPRQWEPKEPQGTAAEIFEARFDLPPGAVPRPVQEQAVEAARAMSGPGLMVMEAPMGEGKTEAALAAAEILGARTGAGGCFVALPTMATSNAMFQRYLHWLERLPGMPEQAVSVFLAHSKAHLNKDFTELMGGGRHLATDTDRDGRDGPDGRGADSAKGNSPAELVAHRWLRGRKKGMLSSFAVGTVDQLLFTGLKSKHLALRHLALAGKVVVIDEAHAYDTYMNVYLDRALAWLGEYGVPVVILSATLPARRRRELVDAYTGTSKPSGSAAAEAAEAVESAREYPLITTAERGSAPRVHTPAASGRSTDVALEPLDDDLGVLADRLDAELAEGGCALVVRNTVARVHETASHLRDRFGSDAITVAHSRFLDLDRADRDAQLLQAYGPPAKVAELGGERPTRHIVVASQVVEQSLDVDFDLLVTDLAPVDLVLQRMGRLHRHPRSEDQSQRPPRLRAARCLVTGVDWAQTPPQPVRGSRTVYGAYPLLRSLAVLRSRLKAGPSPDEVGPGPDGAGGAASTVALPDDISPLVQDAYGEAEKAPPTWDERLTEAREAHEREHARKGEKAQTFLLRPAGRDGRAIVGWVDAGVGEADETRAGKAQVRDTGESLEVLVARRYADGTVTTVPWLSEERGGLPLPTHDAPPFRSARALAASGLRLPYQLTASGAVMDQAISELESQVVMAWQNKDAHWIAGELVLFLDEDNRAELAGHTLHYTESDGLEVHRAD